jgi:hypothetical protein
LGMLFGSPWFVGPKEAGGQLESSSNGLIRNKHLKLVFLSDR